MILKFLAAFCVWMLMPGSAWALSHYHGHHMSHHHTHLKAHVIFKAHPKAGKRFVPYPAYNSGVNPFMVQVLEHPRTDHQCLLQMAYRESRGTSQKDRVLVTRVALARTASPFFPKTACGVVHQKVKKPSGGVRCEFPWSCKSTRLSSIDGTTFTQVAEAVERGEYLHQKYGPIKALFFQRSHRCDPHYRYITTTGYHTYCGLK